LIKALEALDEGTFKYHCNKDKNDFFNWLYRLEGFKSRSGDKKSEDKKDNA
jgi:hypothetical protein